MRVPPRPQAVRERLDEIPVRQPPCASIARPATYAPVPALSTAEAGALRARLEAFEAGAGALAGKLRHKSHLLFTWLNDLIRHARILDAVEDLIGPDILCWGSSFFIKERAQPGYVSWHQDSHLLGPGATRHRHRLGGVVRQHAANGAMRVIPGSHLRDQIAAPRHVRAGQPADRAGRRSWWRSTTREAATLELARRGDVAAPRAADPWLGSEPVRSAADRLRYPLHPDLCAAGGRVARQRDAGARRGPLSAISSRSNGRMRIVGGGGRLPRGGHRRARADPDARHRARDAGVGVGPEVVRLCAEATGEPPSRIEYIPQSQRLRRRRQIVEVNRRLLVDPETALPDKPHWRRLDRALSFHFIPQTLDPGIGRLHDMRFLATSCRAYI